MAAINFGVQPADAVANTPEWRALLNVAAAERNAYEEMVARCDRLQEDLAEMLRMFAIAEAELARLQALVGREIEQPSKRRRGTEICE